MQHPDEGTIHAWLDGALNTEESASLEAHAASCAECSAAIAEARGLMAASSRIVSALDVVPAGVIPTRKPVARPWYASTQLRAAAAVMFVAGASFLIVRDRGSESISDVAQQVMAEQAPAPELSESDAATTQPVPTLPQPSRAATANRAMSGEPGQKKTEASRAASGTVGAVAATEAAQAAADAAPPPPPAPAAMVAEAPPAAELRDTTALAKSTMAAAPVVVTGVARMSQKLSSDLRILGVDSSSAVRITRYRIASGAELTLTEGGEEFTGRGLASRERRFDAARPSAPVPTPAVTEPQAAGTATSRVQVSTSLPVLTISWIDPVTRRVYTLSGRVPKETLEEVREKIQAEKR